MMLFDVVVSIYKILDLFFFSLDMDMDIQSEIMNGAVSEYGKTELE